MARRSVGSGGLLGARRGLVSAVRGTSSARGGPPRSCRGLRLQADGDGQGVEAALFGAAAVGVVPPALSPPDAVGDPIDEGPELRAQHTVERRVRHQHPVVAVAEVQAPPSTLAQVLLVEVSRILVALGPRLDLAPGAISGHPGHLSQQIGIPVHGLVAGGRSGPSQRLGVLG